MTEGDGVGASTRQRLVIQRGTTNDRAQRPYIRALCYPPDADPYTMPTRSYTLEDPHPLPPVPVGALVEIVDTREPPAWPSATQDVPVVRLRTTGSSTPRHGPILAEARGGDVVVHPDHADSVSPYAWTGASGDHVRDSAFARFEGWVHDARKEHRYGWLALVVGAAIVGGLATAWLVFDVDFRRPGRGLGEALAFMVAGGMAVVAARRRTSVARDRGRLDLDDAPRREMVAVAWWATTHGRPVEMWMTLFDRDDPTTGGVVSLPMLDVPEGLDLPDDGVVTVIGEPVDGEVVVIELDDPRRSEAPAEEPERARRRQATQPERGPRARDDGPVRLEPGGRCRSDVLAPTWASAPG